MRTKEEILKEIDYHKEKIKWLNEFIYYSGNNVYEILKPSLKNFEERIKALEWVINDEKTHF